MASRSVLIGAAALALAGCSLLLATEAPEQCTADIDCAANPAHAGRVCREGFCVPPVSTADAGGAVAVVDAGGGGDSTPSDAQANADGSEADAGLGPRSGDLVYLMPEGIESADSVSVDAWRNDAPGSKAKALRAAGGPLVGTSAGGACVTFALADRMEMPDDGTLGLPGDFSVITAVAPINDNPDNSRDTDGRVPVGRVDVLADNDMELQYVGWSFMTEWQNAGHSERQQAFFAARLSMRTSGDATDIRDTVVHDEQMHVLALALRGVSEGTPKLHFWVDEREIGQGTTVAVSQPASAPLSLGKLVTTADNYTEYRGNVCAVIVHGGTESDTDLLARVGQVEARFIH